MGPSKNRPFMLLYKGFKFAILVIKRRLNNSRITLILFFNRKVFYWCLRYGHGNFQYSVFHFKKLVSDFNLLRITSFTHLRDVQLLVLQVLLRLLKKLLQGFDLFAKLLDGVLHALQSCRIVELWLHVLFHSKIVFYID